MADAPLREDTMLYRVPVKDSDPSAIHEIWGKDLETKIVDAPEVAQHVADGWSPYPPHTDAPAKPAAQAALDEAPALQEELDTLRGRIADLEADLKGAEELIASESKAKDEALARVKELEAAAAPPSKK